MNSKILIFWKILTVFEGGKKFFFYIYQAEFNKQNGNKIYKTEKCLELTHWFIYSLAENSEGEDSGNGRSQITGDRLHVVEELAALSRLNDGDPCDTHADQKQHKQPACMNRHLRAYSHHFLLTRSENQYPTHTYRHENAPASNH